MQKRQIRLVEENGLKSTGVVGLITLDPIGPDCRTPTCVEHPVLESGEIRVYRHFAAKGVEFANKMRFCQPANRWIAGHAAQMDEGLGNQQRPASKPCRRKGRLAPSMSATYDKNIVSCCRIEL